MDRHKDPSQCQLILQFVPWHTTNFIHGFPTHKINAHFFFGQENILGSLVEVLVLGDPTAGLCQCALGFPSLTPGTVYLGYTNHHSLDYHQQVTFTT